jgi:hypothetical protein
MEAIKLPTIGVPLTCDKNAAKMAEMIAKPMVTPNAQPMALHESFFKPLSFHLGWT